MKTRQRSGAPYPGLMVLACLLAVMPVALGACGDGGQDGVDTSTYDDTGTVSDTVGWDPGNPGSGCGGYGYGYGPDCVPEGALDCSQDPCIFGTCEVVAGNGTCVCLEGYAGRICGECADGWVARGLRCVLMDACVGFPCAFGTCRILNTQPFCDCNPGYTGDHCDACAEGFVAKNLRCVEEGE